MPILLFSKERRFLADETFLPGEIRAETGRIVARMHFDAHMLTARLHSPDGESFGETLVDSVEAGYEILEITFQDGTRRAWADPSQTLLVLRELGWNTGRHVQEI